MGIPAPRAMEEDCWSELDPPAKRERLLRAAGEVFARSGLQAPMPEVAAAAGAGIGSVYRQFPSKRRLLAALVIERLEEMREDAETAVVSPAGPWAALVSLLRDYAERQAGDDVYAEATACVSTEPDVARAHAATTAAWERLLAAARAEGRLRPDASTDDIRLIFAAMRAASGVEQGAWRRMLELSIDALAAHPS
jgi:AcrR family transcriptional regulator